MLSVVSILLTPFLTWFRSRLSVQMELIALRHQVVAYKLSVSKKWKITHSGLIETVW
jgi:hypothetical protein